MNFSEFKKELKNINFKSDKEWELFLPYDTKREIIQKIIDKCREHLLLNWHIIFGEESELVPQPYIKIYWDKNNLTPPRNDAISV